MLKQTLAQKRQKQREYAKAHYYKMKALKGGKNKNAQPEVPAPTSNGGLIEIINAYRTLHASVKDGNIRADLNKLLAAIIIKNSN